MLPTGEVVRGAKKGGITDHIAGPHLIPNVGREAMVPAECVRRQRPAPKPKPQAQPKAPPLAPTSGGRKKKKKGGHGEHHERRGHSHSPSPSHSPHRGSWSAGRRGHSASPSPGAERVVEAERQHAEKLAKLARQFQGPSPEPGPPPELDRHAAEEAGRREQRRLEEEQRKLRLLEEARRKKEELDATRRKKLGGLFALNDDDDEDVGFGLDQPDGLDSGVSTEGGHSDVEEWHFRGAVRKTCILPWRPGRHLSSRPWNTAFTYQTMLFASASCAGAWPPYLGKHRSCCHMIARGVPTPPPSNTQSAVSVRTAIFSRPPPPALGMQFDVFVLLRARAPGATHWSASL